MKIYNYYTFIHNTIYISNSLQYKKIKIKNMLNILHILVFYSVLLLKILNILVLGVRYIKPKTTETEPKNTGTMKKTDPKPQKEQQF